MPDQPTSDCKQKRPSGIGSSAGLGRRELWLRNNGERVRAYKRKSAKKAYAANPRKFCDRSKAWRRDNNQAARERDARYREKYAATRCKQFKAWWKSHRGYFRERNRKQVDELANWYVRQKLSQNTTIKPSDWPAALVDLKRAEMKVRKLCRE